MYDWYDHAYTSPLRGVFARVEIQVNEADGSLESAWNFAAEEQKYTKGVDL